MVICFPQIRNIPSAYNKHVTGFGSFTAAKYGTRCPAHEYGTPPSVSCRIHAPGIEFHTLQPWKTLIPLRLCILWKVFLQKLWLRHLPGNGVNIFGIKCGGATISSKSWEWSQLYLPLMQKYATKTTFSICIGLTVWFPQNMHGHFYRYFCHFYWKWPISWWWTVNVLHL